MSRVSRLDARQPKWWTELYDWCAQYDVEVGSPMYDHVFDVIQSAISEDKAAELGSLGGLRGGKARAASMTPEQRSEAARKAARARWGRG